MAIFNIRPNKKTELINAILGVIDCVVKPSLRANFSRDQCKKLTSLNLNVKLGKYDSCITTNIKKLMRCNFAK
jgi:hypothetical protein